MTELNTTGNCRGGMHTEDVPLGSNVIPILVAAQILLNAQISRILAAT